MLHEYVPSSEWAKCCYCEECETLQWDMYDNPFDPTKTDTFAYIADGRGPDRQAGLEGLHRRESILVGQRRGDGVRGRLAPRGRGLRSTTAVG